MSDNNSNDNQMTERFSQVGVGIPVGSKTLVQEAGRDTEAWPGQKVECRVTKYNKKDVSEEDKDRVQWKTRIDGEYTNLEVKGEKVPIEIKKEWAGKEVFVMPYLHSAKVGVEVKITVFEVSVITTDKGKELFTLDASAKLVDKDGKPVKLDERMKALALYAIPGVNWFEPGTINYTKLISIDQNLTKSDRLKHFSWKEIFEFAKITRSLTRDYQDKGSGDWKSVEDGGQGYLLVTVGGVPYWADAIGQIPFALDCFRQHLKLTKDHDTAQKMTVMLGKLFANGKPLKIKSDRTNSYDNAMILRAIKWARKRYSMKKVGKTWELTEDAAHSPEELSKASDGKTDIGGIK